MRTKVSITVTATFGYFGVNECVGCLADNRGRLTLAIEALATLQVTLLPGVEESTQPLSVQLPAAGLLPGAYKLVLTANDVLLGETLARASTGFVLR